MTLTPPFSDRAAINAWRTNLDPSARKRWVRISLICSLLAMASMIISEPDIDSHPATCAFSITWVIGGFVGLFTQKWLFGIDPWQFHFVRWEREGQVYHWTGVTAFRWQRRYQRTIHEHR